MTETFACAYCDFEGGRLELHGHVVEEHADQLETGVREKSGESSIYFALPCPECDDEQFSREIHRGRGDDRRAIELYRDEVAMIAFDQLLYHLEEEHGY